MRFLDLYPLKGCFHPGEQVSLAVELESDDACPATMRVRTLHLADVVDEAWVSRSATAGQSRIALGIRPTGELPAGGYGVVVELFDATGRAAGSRSTAFDVLEDWTAHPRYGFLCDFSPHRGQIDETMDRLLRFHINGLQFYDWQHRHDDLLPRTDDYPDCLGRPLSLITVRSLIEAAHERNMAAMPYLAVYAASAPFWRSHPEWALYDREGRPIPFGEDFLGIMNPAPGTGWPAHLLDECARVLDALPFDGLHVDQYGEPKEGYDTQGRAVDIASAFAAFVAAATERFEDAPVLFNAVGNWPIAELAAAPVAFNYIEVWPPDTGYADLLRIVRDARQRSGNKAVTIALYLPAARAANNLLADALIFAGGGCRIAVGEDGRLLSDPYFPKHEPMAPELATAMREIWDFAVRYGEWTGPAAADAADMDPVLPEEVWGVARRAGATACLHLVNFTGCGPEPRWDESLPAPRPLCRAPVSVALAERPGRVLWAGASDDATLAPLHFTWLAGRLSVVVPSLDLWGVLIFEPAEPEAI